MVNAVMVGYRETAGYHLWDPQAHHFFWLHDIVFEEGLGHWSRAPAGGDMDDAGVDDTHTPIPVIESADAPTPTAKLPPAPVPVAEPVPVVIEPHHSARTRNPSKALQDSHDSHAEEEAVKVAREPWERGDGKPKKPQAVAVLNISTASVASIPKNYQQAIQSLEVWMPPMQKEYVALIGHETWVLVDLPPGVNVVDCKWVYTVKYDTEGEVVKWKAQLVVKGFQQIKGIDFFETYAGVVRYESLRMLWAIAVEEPRWVMWAMDVVSTYLNSEMKETVYMHQPEGFLYRGRRGRCV
jgi:hypothetical protein